MTSAANSSAAPAVITTRLPARVAFAGGLLSLTFLASLHALRPDLDPSWHVVSEYAVGTHGWVMTLCFLSLAIGCAALAVTLFPVARTGGGKIGLAFLLAAAVGLTMAAMFPMDPITVPPDQATTSGKMHGVAGMIGIPSLVIAAVLLSFALRKDREWAPVRAPMLALAHLNWISVTLMFGFLFLLMQQGTGGLGGLIGYANRLLMLAYGGWIMIAAWPLVRKNPHA